MSIGHLNEEDLVIDWMGLEKGGGERERERESVKAEMMASRYLDWAT